MRLKVTVKSVWFLSDVIVSTAHKCLKGFNSTVMCGFTSSTRWGNVSWQHVFNFTWSLILKHHDYIPRPGLKLTTCQINCHRWRANLCFDVGMNSFAVAGELEQTEPVAPAQPPFVHIVYVSGGRQLWMPFLSYLCVDIWICHCLSGPLNVSIIRFYYKQHWPMLKNEGEKQQKWPPWPATGKLDHTQRLGEEFQNGHI